MKNEQAAVKCVTACLLALWSVSSAAAEEASAARGAEDRNMLSLEITRRDSQPASKGPAATFTGDVRIESRFQHEAPAGVSGATVTFQPGAHTAWHTHPLGQTLIVTAGTGWVQREGGPRQQIQDGDIVLIPPNVKHWHGATVDTAMTHVAIAEALEGNVVTWMEHVSDEQYRATSVAR